MVNHVINENIDCEIKLIKININILITNIIFVMQSLNHIL